MPRGHCGVRGEHGVPRDRLERGVELGAALHDAADALQDQERGVAFVDVPDRGPHAGCGQRAHAADPEHDLLLHARRAVAAVQAVGDEPIALRIFRQVGVEQVKRHVADPALPDLEPERSAGQLDRNPQFGATAIRDRLDRQVVEIRVVVGRVLVALGVDGLQKITLAVEQPDRDERQPQVARRLAVVAGENSQPA